MSGIFFGGAGAGNGIASITVSSNWGSTGPGASPQTSPTRTITVPSGNPGVIKLSISGTGASNCTISRNAGGFTAIADGDLPTWANGDTIAFRLAGAGLTATIGVQDNSTLASIGTSTITNS